MKAGGYRTVRISPYQYLAYREKGVQNVVSPNAALIVEIRLREIYQERRVSMS